jgi:hypothetical protein
MWNMNDLELTYLCAEAMGFDPAHYNDTFHYPNGSVFDPLHNDAQAMALVTKFELHLGYYENGWLVTKFGLPVFRESRTERVETFNTNLNRAIVECVAKISCHVELKHKT